MSHKIGRKCGSMLDGSGWEVNPAGTEGICMVVESIGWDLLAPHMTLRASTDFAAKAFDGPEDQEVAEAIRKTWNRVLARNMVYTEATIQKMLGSVREAVGHLQVANCEMAAQSLGTMYGRPDGRVSDGMRP